MNQIINLILTLLVNTSFSWIRMFIALGLSIIFSLFIGIAAARSKFAEKIILPILDIFQTLPILAFFPFVIIIVLSLVRGDIGVNIAVIFLIFTSMVWNISFAVYEAIKVLPNEFLELAEIYKMNLFQRLKKIYIPSSMPRIMEQSVLSWSIGLFYLITSEIFSTGNSMYSVKYGIGVELINLGYSGNLLYYLIGIFVLIIFVIFTRFLFFIPLENYFNKFKDDKQQRPRLSKLYELFAAPFLISRSKIKNRKNIKSNKLNQKYKTRDNKLAVRKSYKNNYLFTLFNNLNLYLVRFNSKIKQRARIFRALLIFIFISAFFILIIFIYLTYPKFLIQVSNYEYLSLISLVYSFTRVWITFLIISLIAVPLSIYLIFISKNSNKFLSGFQILASIPATILLPIIVLYFKNNGNIVAFLIFFISGIWYVIFSIMASSKTLEKQIFEVKSIFNIRGIQAFKKIYLKAIIPGFITGAVTAIAAEWNASIVAE